MRATTAVEYQVKCPDCGSQTHLMAGKYGRFYQCCRIDCSGTRGAHLDGKPIKPTGSRDLVRARIRARNAVHRMVLERDRIERETVQWKQLCGVQASQRSTRVEAWTSVAWWNHDHSFLSCKDDFRAIAFAAKLEPI